VGSAAGHCNRLSSHWTEEGVIFKEYVTNPSYNSYSSIQCSHHAVPQHIVLTLLFPLRLSLMPGIDSYDMYLSALGFIPKLRFLLPRNVIPPVSALLNETRQLLDHAEAIGAILPQSECRSHFER
jgi:hypothetical protein